MQIVRAERLLKKDPDYNPTEGFTFHIDYVANIPKNICNQMKIAYAIFNKGEIIVGNKQLGPVLTTPEEYSVMNQRAQFSKKAIIKDIEPDIDTNIIIEVQIPENMNSYSYEALGWTLLNLFDFGSDRLFTGIYKLPLYHTPTDPSLSVNDILNKLTPIDVYI